MAFHLISSNKVELLMAQMAAVLDDQPLRDPFVPELILVPSMPMQSWLSQQLALRKGINCNNEFPLPATWVWAQVSAADAQAPKQDPLGRESAAWLIFRLLPRLLDDEAFAPLQRYLQADAEGVKRWQLSERIADLFDRYQYYRPQLIRDWSKGAERDNWQALLWRELINVVGKTRHRVALIDRFMRQLADGKADALPERITLFAVASLPPLLLQLLQEVALHSDLYLYYLSPTDSYWADLVPARVLAKKRLEQEAEGVYYETGHELLASWGRQGQVFQDLLLQHDSLQSLEFDCHDPSWPSTLLGQLQQDLFAVEQAQHHDDSETIKTDDSLQLHICHSALRECQVLHDALLTALDADPSLKPEDVLVLVPEISRYAPYIEAVFARDEARPFVPWNLSDISLADEHPLILTFLQLLELPASRFPLSEILSLLEVPELCRRFGLDADQVALVRGLVEKLHVRWGIDGAHRDALGLPDGEGNSWKQAERRLLAGFAMGEGELWNGIAASEAGQGEMTTMTLFWNLFEQLKRWRERLQGDRSGSGWQSLLAEMVDELFYDPQDQSGRLQLIQDALADLASQTADLTLSRELVIYWLTAQLAGQQRAGRYFSGGVSFCGMQPMRSLPFKMICLLGMQDTAFPAREHPVDFDLMAGHWQPGDPVKGEMDRYLLLETLLCARKQLYISYTGRSIRDNSECQPSVLVAELLDLLTQQWGSKRVDALTQLHPMQPFSADNYRETAAYDGYWCQLANAVEQRQSQTAAGQGWPAEPLPDDAERGSSDGGVVEIELGRLLQFVRHPVKYFYNRSLNIYLQQEDAGNDDEPFALEGLEGWQVKKRLLDAALASDDDASERMQAEGMLPHGGFGGLAVEKQRTLVAPMFRQVEPYKGAEPLPVQIDLTFTDLTFTQDKAVLRLSGQVRGYYPGIGLMHVVPSKLSGKYLLLLWIEHLALCAAGVLQAGETGVLICRDGRKQVDVVPQAEARELLAGYLDLFRQGERQPLPLFPAASWLYSNGRPEAMVETAWNGNPPYASGDREDAYIAMVMAHVSASPLTDSLFQATAHAFYDSVVEAIGDGK